MFDYPTYIIIILSILHYHLNGTHLSVNFDHGFAMARINLVPAVRAQTDPGNIICELITDIMLVCCTMFPSCVQWDHTENIGYIFFMKNHNLLHIETLQRNAFNKNGRFSRAIPRTCADVQTGKTPLDLFMLLALFALSIYVFFLFKEYIFEYIIISFILIIMFIHEIKINR